MDEFEQLILQNIGEFKEFLRKAHMLAIVVLDENLRIASHNKCFSALVSSGEDVSGIPIHSFLLPESHDLLPLSDSADDRSVRLNMKSRDFFPVTLQCHIFRIGDGRRLIFGENPMLANEEILKKMTIMSNEMANMARDLQRKNRELKKALAAVKTLSGLLPICSYCKKIRDDNGYWNRIEAYIEKHSNAEFSHSICKECAEEYYPEMDLYNDDSL